MLSRRPTNERYHHDRDRYQSHEAIGLKIMTAIWLKTMTAMGLKIIRALMSKRQESDLNEIAQLILDLCSDSPSFDDWAWD